MSFLYPFSVYTSDRRRSGSLCSSGWVTQSLLANKYGEYAIVCGSYGESITRHNQLSDAIYKVAPFSNLSLSNEKNALIPGN